jgi:glycosyltransferase involved in cell wall biosynthesis/predicted O-methyltransferase YrrM
MTSKKTNKSDLDSLIPPEIKNDEFYKLIQEIAATSNIKSILEIGSSSGGGSTEAFVKGIQNNPHKPTLYCMEVSQVRFAQLQQTYAYADFVKCYNLSSIAVESFPTKEEVIEFYNTNRTGLNGYPLEEVLRWLDQDTEYVVSSGASENGIKRIKEENSIDYFDVVLIDGSEFTGKVELDEIYGAKYIFLDDINTFKNHHNFERLCQDLNYILVSENVTIRNGYGIFQKISAQPISYKTIQSNVETIEGFMIPGQEEYLFNKVKTLPSDAVIVEIGSYKGRSTVAMAYACIGTNRKIYCIDTWDGNDTDFPDRNFFDIWQENVQKNGLGEYVLPCQGYSHQVLTQWNQISGEKAIDFIFIDGSHQFLDVLKDFELSFPLIKENGWMAFHDVIHTWPGSERVWHNIAKYRLTNHEYSTTLACGQKKFAISTSSLLPELSIHFFTIVLNGEPFIRYHIDVFKELSFKWHWHIVEGVADLKHDTAWSTRQGGHIAGNIHRNGRSNDGTTEYIDELARLYPENITIYRKPEGEFWDGKREMVQAPLANITEECLLWQVDVDELWTVEQIWLSRQLFIESPEKTAAYYWCWYFVGEKLVISTRNCYAQNPQQEWLRTWRFKPGYTWAAHEPPILVEHLADDNIRDVAKINPLLHEETEKYNLVFQHYSYVLPEQLKFKETYYGYKSAESQWLKLQEAKTLPLFLSEYLSWVTDGTRVDSTESLGIVPIAQKDSQTDNWKFLSSLELNEKSLYAKPKSKKDFRPIIAIDGVFFQLYKTGIARVWTSLLEEWVANGFARNIVVFDREGSAPKIAGIWYRTVDRYDYAKTDADRQMLQKVCDEEGVQLFISTYYTTPINTPSVFMAYDMIPEVFTFFDKPEWREKHIGIQHASSYITISENTAQDLVKYFPAITANQIQIAHCGIKDIFSPASLEEIKSFKTKYGIAKSYFLLVGAATGYKNLELFLEAFVLLPTKQSFEIVFTGSGTSFENKLRSYTSGSVVHMLQLSNEDLRTAYTGAIALVYPSKYEGFGLPVLEALACGCPVITCPNSSIPEVAGEAAIYVQDDDVNGLANALCDVQKPQERQVLIKTGLEQSKKFSWTKMAEKVSSALLNASLLDLNLRDINLIIFPDWAADEESLGLELAEVVKAIATHPKSSQITLLINTNNIDQDEANLLLSSVAMHLLMEEELEIPEYVEISLVGHLEEIQWQTLLPRLQGRILLENEDKKATFIEKIPAISILEL